MCKEYFVYLILTEKNTLYCGFTDDVEKRFKQHLLGLGAKYTRANKPVKVVWQKAFKTKSEALKEEYRIKHRMTRKEKLELFGGLGAVNNG